MYIWKVELTSHESFHHATLSRRVDQVEELIHFVRLLALTTEDVVDTELFFFLGDWIISRVKHCLYIEREVDKQGALDLH